MAIEKAALFVDNSNIFKGLNAYSKHLSRTGGLKEGQGSFWGQASVIRYSNFEN